jgi:hypothetical protein
LKDPERGWGGWKPCVGNFTVEAAPHVTNKVLLRIRYGEVCSTRGSCRCYNKIVVVLSSEFHINLGLHFFNTRLRESNKAGLL